MGGTPFVSRFSGTRSTKASLTVMLLAMLVMSLAAWCYSVAVVLHRARSIILVREAHTQWVHELQEHPEKS